MYVGTFKAYFLRLSMTAISQTVKKKPLTEKKRLKM